ncbi:hypothetical protein ACFXMT_33670 [Streptomyces mirabilis]|uniref:hypothetical protein n=1 Tax=Streptomyces mirabilis TaxID=68239 RepID=UPI0036C6502C
MTRPLTGAELAAEKRKSWLLEEERRARARGDQGRMEFWLRLTRSRIAKEIKADRRDVYAGFTLICRLFMTAMDKRAAGDQRLWNDLMQYAQRVVDQNPPRN